MPMLILLAEHSLELLHTHVLSRLHARALAQLAATCRRFRPLNAHPRVTHARAFAHTLSMLRRIRYRVGIARQYESKLDASAGTWYYAISPDDMTTSTRDAVTYWLNVPVTRTHRRPIEELVTLRTSDKFEEFHIDHTYTGVFAYDAPIRDNKPPICELWRVHHVNVGHLFNSNLMFRTINGYLSARDRAAVLATCKYIRDACRRERPNLSCIQFKCNRCGKFVPTPMTACACTRKKKRQQHHR